MNKETLIAAGKAAYGDNFVTPLSDNLSVSDRTIRHWINGKYNVPALEKELIEVLESRKQEIEQTIKLIKGTLKMTTAFNIYEAAFDSACSEYHEYTADHVQKYADNALDISITDEVAQLIADKAKEWNENGNGENDFYHEVEKPLSEIVIE